MTPLHFCEKGVKAGARVYQEDVLQGVEKQLNTTVFSGQKWIFQQNSSPAEQDKMTQEWMQGTSCLYQLGGLDPGEARPQHTCL
jgi:hypothetical protein